MKEETKKLLEAVEYLSLALHEVVEVLSFQEMHDFPHQYYLRAVSLASTAIDIIDEIKKETQSNGKP